MWQQVKFVVGVVLELTQILNWGKEPKKSKDKAPMNEQGQEAVTYWTIGLTLDLNLDQTNRLVLLFFEKLT